MPPDRPAQPLGYRIERVVPGDRLKGTAIALGPDPTERHGQPLRVMHPGQPWRR